MRDREGGREKRVWVYPYPPSHYAMECTNNRKHRIEWSEFAGLIWCFECKEDMRGFGGIFDGPIPVEATKMMLGELCFHRFDLKRKCLMRPVTRAGKIYYRKDAKETKKYAAAALDQSKKGE